MAGYSIGSVSVKAGEGASRDSLGWGVVCREQARLKGRTVNVANVLIKTKIFKDLFNHSKSNYSYLRIILSNLKSYVNPFGILLGN